METKKGLLEAKTLEVRHLLWLKKKVISKVNSLSTILERKLRETRHLILEFVFVDLTLF